MVVVKATNQRSTNIENERREDLMPNASLCASKLILLFDPVGTYRGI